MNKSLYDFFTEDHHRIDQLLEKAIENPAEINLDYYYQFRSQILRHIMMEEKVFFLAAKLANPEIMQELLPQYRLEHGAITALMVPPPTLELIKVIKYLLDVHDQKEEEDGGMYEICEALAKDQTEALMAKLNSIEEVPLHPPNPAPIAVDSAKRALIRAGYDYDEILRIVNAS